LLPDRRPSATPSRAASVPTRSGITPPWLHSTVTPPATAAAALDRVQAAAAFGGITVLCSQGGVIPDLVGTLAGRDGVALGRRSGSKIPARKASTWALSFVDTRLAAADYYPDLALAAKLTP